MNELQQGILTWLKSALTGETLPLPENLDLDAACRLVRAHQLTAMAYDGASRCGVDQSHPAMQTLFQRYVKVMQISARQLQALEKLYAAFEGQGIVCLPLKGCIMKALYPKPELRIMGDADILIRTEQYEQIVPILQTLGFRRVQESDYDYSWENDALHLELHKSLFPPQDADFTRYFGTGWDFASTREGHRHAMSAADSFIYMFAHFAKHFRGAGVGCRQMTDLWVYLRAHPELDEAVLADRLEQLHLLRFYRNIRRTLAVWFEGGAEDELTAFITDYVFDSGCWGTSQNAALSLGVRDQQTAGKSNERFAYIWRRLFPGVKRLYYDYPIVKKLPVLIPFAWVHYLSQRILHNETGWGQHLKNISAVNQDNVNRQKKLLSDVGLDFHQ